MFWTKMKRYFFLLLLFLAVFAQGCSPTESTRHPKSRVPVDFWVMWTGFEFQAMQEIVDQFNASQDEVVVTALSVSDIRRKLLIAIAGNDAPDVALLIDDMIPQFADRNALRPIDEYLPSMEVNRDAYVPIFWDICAYEGKLYGLPASTISLAMHWNKDAFEEAGLDPDRAPRTVDELDAWCERLTQTNEDGSYSTIGFLPTQPGWWPFCWVWWFGGSWLDEDGNPSANRPENIQAFEWIRSYSEKYGVHSLQNFTSNLGNFSSAQNGFFSGRNKMVLQGVWMSNFIDQYAPDLAWGAAPFPSAAGQVDGITMVQCDALVIPRNARNPDAAARFIGFVQRAENLNALALAHGKFSPLAGDQMEMQDHPNKDIEVFVELSRSPNARAIPRTPIWAEYSAELGQAFESVWLGSMTAEQALDRVQERMEKKWADYLRIRDAIRRKRAS